LYIGRLEEGKNVPLLYDYVRRYVEDGGNLQLIVGGSGPRHPPAHPAFDYRGFVSEEEKMSLCASALALCQPSLNESFSITIMESWLAGRPVLVHRDCRVTQGHVERSKGGLWFSTYEIFSETIDWLLRTPRQASQMGQNGQKYVHENYSWKIVVERLELLLEREKSDE
jgi:glycosyltransferase involved in cell wall biosynthesis